MKVVISTCVFAAVAMVAAGAPALAQGELPEQTKAAEHQPEYRRQKRSSYGGGGGQYISSCGASLPALAPAPAYQLNLGAVGHGGYGHAGVGYGAHGYGGGGYGLPHYRSDVDENEMMTFSDMDPLAAEHLPMARYAYGGAAGGNYGGAGLGGIGGLVAPAAAGPAYGVFPNAHVGGCAVPLLLSCSPRIVPGQLVKSHGYGGASIVPAAGAEAYRGVDEHQHHESHDQNEDQPAHEHMPPAHESGQNVHQ